MKKQKCRIRPEGGEGCKREYYASLKVRVQHSDTGRITYQTWHLCKLHFKWALQGQMKDWYTWYPKQPFKKAFVLNFTIIDNIGVV